jgi:hypothetical protein
MATDWFRAVNDALPLESCPMISPNGLDAARDLFFMSVSSECQYKLAGFRLPARSAYETPHDILKKRSASVLI